MTQENISNIQLYQEGHSGVMFGEAAVSLNLLSSNQLKYLLDLRTRRQEPIGHILLKNVFITQEALNKTLMGYNKKRNRFENIIEIITHFV